jgi:transposase
MDLTDEQWSVIRPLIPEPTRRKDGKGRPWRDSREVMNGILWILLRTGACWYDMPDRYPPPYQTCHHGRFQQWVRSGVFRQILEALANDLCDRGGIDDLSECYNAGMFIVAKKRGRCVGKTKRGKGTKNLMTVAADSTGVPAISVYVASTASPHEVITLAEDIVTKCFVSNEKPEHLVGSKA